MAATSFELLQYKKKNQTTLLLEIWGAHTLVGAIVAEALIGSFFNPQTLV